MNTKEKAGEMPVIHRNKPKAFEYFFLQIYKEEGSGRHAFYKNAGLR